MLVLGVNVYPPSRRDILETSVAAVEKESNGPVVRRNEIEPPVAVDIRRARPYGPVGRGVRRPAAPGKTGLAGHVGERSAIVSKQAVRVAIHVSNVDVEIAVLVKIEPHRAHAPPGVGETDAGCDISKAPSLVAEERVRAVAERHEQIEIAVRVHVNPDRLPDGAGFYLQTDGAGDIDEACGRVAIEPKDRCVVRREADEQVGIAVCVEIAPCSGAGGSSIGNTGARGIVHQRAGVVAVQPVCLPVESDEEIEVVVSVVVGPGVDEAAACRQRVGLNGIEPEDGGRENGREEKA